MSRRRRSGRNLHGILLLNKRLGVSSNRALQEVRRLFDAKKASILIHGCFIVGLPGDTRASLQANLDYAKSMPFDSIQAIPLIPTPGEPSYEWAKKNNYLISEDYSHWLKKDGRRNCVISRPDLTKEQVEKWVERFYKEFVIRGDYFLYKMIQSLKSYQEFKRNFKAFWKFVSY